MAAPTVGDADRKDRGASIEELTMFPPYEDPPKGAFSKITSFLARFSSEGEPSEPATQPLPRHFEGVTSSGLHSGQMSVRSNPPKRAQYRGVPPMQLSRALRDLEDRNSRIFKDYWISDSTVKECSSCQAKFTVTLRRHHCRLCGHIFCSTCCSESIPGSVISQEKPVRACKSCAKMVSEKNELPRGAGLEDKPISITITEDEAGDMVLPVDREDQLLLTTSPTSTPALQPSSSSLRSGSFKGWEDSIYGSLGGSGLGSSFTMPAGNETNDGMDESEIYDIFLALVNPQNGLLPTTHRKWLRFYSDTYKASDIVSWLTDNGYVENEEEAVIIGQKLVHMRVLKVVATEEKTFSNDPSLILRPNSLLGNYAREEKKVSSDSSWSSIWRDQPKKPQEANPEDSTAEVEEPDEMGLTSSKSAAGKAQPEQGPVRVSRLNSDDFQPIFTKPSSPPTERDWESYNRRILLELDKSSKVHWEYFFRQVLGQEGLSDIWFEVIKQVAMEASHSVKPYLNANSQQLDILPYIKIKKLPGGSPVDTSLYFGEVFTKTLPFKHYLLQNGIKKKPKIMLLKCALEVHRQPNSITSMEDLKLQEREYIENLIQRIHLNKPDILVIQDSITGMALDKLLALNMLVITNVKEEVMDRLAHCTEADLVTSLRSISPTTKCGYCEKFYLKSYRLPSGRKKMLMFFDECQRNKACTIILRGTSEDLSKVKRVLRFAIFAAYSNFLENRFLWNEFAEPLPLSRDAYSAINRMPVVSSGSNGDTFLYPCLDVFSPSTEDTQPVNKERSPPLSSESSLSSPRDSLLLFGGSSPHSISEYSFPDKKILLTKENIFKTNLQCSVLTTSPHIQYTIPHLITNSPTLKPVMRFIPDTLFWSQKFLPDKGVASGVIAKRTAPPELGRDASQRYFNESSPSHVFPTVEVLVPLESKADAPNGSIHKPKGYTSVTTHPFISSLIHSTTDDYNLRTKLADFKARAGIPGEPANFLFPSAQEKENYAKSNHNQRFLESPGKGKPRRKPVAKPVPKGVNCSSLEMKRVRAIFTKPPFSECVAGREVPPKEKKEVQSKVKPVPKSNSLDLLGYSDSLLAFRNGGMTEQSVNEKFDCMDPYNHQRIDLHYSTSSPKSPHFPRACNPARNLTLFFYGKNDHSLGDFLHMFCFSNGHCGHCRLSCYDHALHIAHGKAVISITMEIDNAPLTKDLEVVTTWHKCKQCQKVTPRNVLSPEAMALSFGKYLEIRFGALDYVSRMSSSSSDLKPCSHSLHHDHIQYFCYKDIIASFNLNPVDLYEVQIPPMVLHISYLYKTEFDWIEEVSSTNKVVHEFFDEVNQKLKEFEIYPPLNERSVLLQKQYEDKRVEFGLQVRSLNKAVSDAGFMLPGDNSIPHTLDTTVISLAVVQLQDGVVSLKRQLVQVASQASKHFEEFQLSVVELNQSKSSHYPQKQLPSGPKLLTGLATEEIESSVTYSEVGIEDSASDRPSPVKGVHVKTTAGGTPTGTDQDYRNNEVLADKLKMVSATLEKQVSQDNAYNVDTGDTEVKNTDKEEYDYPAFRVFKKIKSRSTIDSDIDEDHFAIKEKKKERVPLPPFFGRSRNQLLFQPFPLNEHYYLDLELTIPAAVYESEPSSIIACALSSNKYKNELKKIKQTPATAYPTGKISQQAVLSNESPNSAEISVAAANDVDGVSEGNKVSPHILIEFGNQVAVFKCNIFCANEFKKLRDAVYPLGEEKFVRSLLRCKPWKAQGGKSGSSFCKVVDDRFVLKQIKKSEIVSFLHIAQDYFDYIEKAISNRLPTCLTKILGVYNIKFFNKFTGQSSTGDFIVMENLRYSRSSTKVYDLKGSMRNRLVKTSVPDNVYQDENLLRYLHTNPVYMHAHSKRILMEALTADTEFLANHNVMDYSLLTAICPDSCEVVVGIIDYLRKFTLDKKLEMGLKTYILVAGSKGQPPTILSPDKYRQRFLREMDQYFSLIPDRWSFLSGYIS